MTHEIHTVVSEHSPRPTGDPMYVPYWAKGEYARRNRTKYTTEEGSTIEAGQVVKEGHGSARKGQPVYQPQCEAKRGTETPRRAEEGRSKASRTLDLAATLVKMCSGAEEKRALARKHGLDPAILDNAPNPGVASMRLVNALRKALNAAA